MLQTRIVRQPALKDLIGLSMSSIRRLIAQGEFPRPIRLSAQAVGWDVADIQAWIQSRKEASQ